MKKILLLATVSLVACKSVQNIDVSDYQVKEADVAKTLQYLASDELEGRDSNSKGIEKAANYLESILETSDIKPYFSTYKDTLSNYENSYNVVGYIEGADKDLKNEFLILGAHYDHIGITEKGFEGDHINNGANDNAPGTTILSEIAKDVGRAKNSKRSVLIVFFSAEEKGVLGSKRLAEKLKKQRTNVYAML